MLNLASQSWKTTAITLLFCPVLEAQASQAERSLAGAVFDTSKQPTKG